MSPFSIPAPCIIPLRLPVFGGPKSIDTNVKIQLLCETYLDHEIFYTLDGTRPQPYAGIVQGSKLIKYSSPFCLPAGKITIKAIAINANVHTMCSSVVTKCFEVLKVDPESDSKSSSTVKKVKKLKQKKCDSVEDSKNESGMTKIENESCAEISRSNPDSTKDDEVLNCFDEAFIGGSAFESDNSELQDSIEDETIFPVNNVIYNDSLEDIEDMKLCDVGFVEKDQKYEDSLSEAVEELQVNEETMGPNDTLTNDMAVSADTQFCCLKCDMTLQQCVSCNRMNGVSSKFCIGCGKQLSRICSLCTEYNPAIATFCQYCGHKLNSNDVKLKPSFQLKVDHSIMATPESKNAAIQILPVVIDKDTQTVSDKSPVKRSPVSKRSSRHSPGRGYWHQQLDYICNHIKSHAYNNMEFRREISEPVLCDFKSAQITKDEENITVTVVFSNLKNKIDSNVSEKIMSKYNEG